MVSIVIVVLVIYQNNKSGPKVRKDKMQNHTESVARALMPDTHTEIETDESEVIEKTGAGATNTQNK